MANCKQCGKEFEAKRADALFCSDACKHRSYRVPDKITESVPDKITESVPDKPTYDTAKRSHKRGQDIQCFADLPPDVQADIERDSRACEVDGVKFTQEQDRQARTARAIKYQHLFPGRYHSMGIERVPASFKLPGYKTADQLAPSQFNRVTKPGDADYEGPKGPGSCYKCGAQTQSPLITCCYSCAIGKTEATVTEACHV